MDKRMLITSYFNLKACNIIKIQALFAFAKLKNYLTDLEAIFTGASLIMCRKL